MTFSQFIAGFERRNPGVFSQEYVRIKPETLRALLRQAHDAGEKNAKPGVPLDPPWDSIFGRPV